MQVCKQSMFALLAVTLLHLATVLVDASIAKSGGGGCSDKYDDVICGAFKETKKCENKRGYSWTFCRKTCELCGMCTDFSMCCSKFGKEQECFKNPDWMNAECPKKCGICEGLSGWAVAVISGFPALAKYTPEGECDLEGVLIDLIKKYAEETEADPVSYDESEPYSGDAVVQMVTEGKSNIGAALLTVADHFPKYRFRKQMVDFTEPFYEDEVIGMIFIAGSCGIRRLEQLAASDFKWCLIKDGVVDTYLRSQKGEIYSKIRKGAEYVADYEEGMSKARSKKYVYLEESLYAQALVQQYCDVEAAELKDEIIENYALAVPKGFEGLKALNGAIKKNKIMLKKLIKTYLRQDCEEEK